MAMTQAEIRSLMEQARREERAAKTMLKQRSAELQARMEEQLAAAYRSDHERWKAITEEAEQRVNDVISQAKAAADEARKAAAKLAFWFAAALLAGGLSGGLAAVEGGRVRDGIDGTDTYR